MPEDNFVLVSLLPQCVKTLFVILGASIFREVRP